MAIRGMKTEPTNKLPEALRKHRMWTLHLQIGVFNMTERVILARSANDRE